MNYPKSWGPDGCCGSGVDSTHHHNAVRNLEEKRIGPTIMRQNLVALAVAAGIVIGLLIVFVLGI